MRKKGPYRSFPLLGAIRRASRRAIAKVFYRGTRVECSVCHRHFSNWLGRAAVGFCPSCGSAVRHRILCFVFDKDRKEHGRPIDVVHFAPERCIEQRLRADQTLNRYVTADLSAPNVDIHTDLQGLVFTDCSFDVVICSHVLEHVPNDVAAIAELYRVVRSGGMAYVQVPFADDRPTDEDPSIVDPAERERRFGQFDHLRLYGTDLQQRLEAGGFRVEALRPVSDMSAAEACRLGFWDEVLFRCTKP